MSDEERKRVDLTRLPPPEESEEAEESLEEYNARLGKEYKATQKKADSPQERAKALRAIRHIKEENKNRKKPK